MSGDYILNSYSVQGSQGYYWSSTPGTYDYGGTNINIFYNLQFDSNSTTPSNWVTEYGKSFGLSVRCIKGVAITTYTVNASATN